MTRTEITTWSIARLAHFLERPAQEIDPAQSFAELGLDSANSVHFILELEEWLGRELDPEIVQDHPSIAALSAYLAEGTG